MLITTEADKQNVIVRIQAFTLKKPMVVTAEEYKPNRSLAQNKLAFKWYSEIAKQSGEGIDDERNKYKWKYGCEILSESSSTFSEFYGNLVARYTYEENLKAMEFVQVTSLMKVSEFALYLKRVEQSAIERGFVLSHPSDLYYQAIGESK